MLLDNMDFAKLSNLNYCRVSLALDTDVFVQCILSKEEKREFKKEYINTITSIFADSGVDTILAELIDAYKKNYYTQVIPDEVGSFGYIYYSSLVETLINYLRRGKNNEIVNVSKLFNEEREIDESVKFANEMLRDVIRKIRKQLVDIKDSNVYNVEQLQKDYPAALAMAGLSITGKSAAEYKGTIMIGQGVEKSIECLTQLIFANKKMFDASLKHTINLGKYNIDKDKYLFYIFSTYLEEIIKFDDGALDKNIYPVLSYFKETVDRDNSNLFFYGMDEKNFTHTRKYTYKDFVRNLQEYVKAHREINCDILPFDYFDGWDAEEVNEFLDLFTEETLSNFMEIDPEILFLPSGKNNTDKKDKGTSTEVKEKVFSLLPLEKREFYSKNRDKIHMSLLGEKKFKGYILNVLNNGYVIFEKYDTKEEDISNKNAAAYIMNIFNFKSLYEMSPTEIRKFSKAQDKSKPLFDRVDYKCHMGKWQEHLQKYFDEDTGIIPNDIDEVFALEKVKAIEYTKKKEEE